jgi:hypothetical protein
MEAHEPDLWKRMAGVLLLSMEAHESDTLAFVLGYQFL